MIDENKLNKELGVLKLTVPDSCKEIIRLVEHYLSVSDKMPEKLEITKLMRATGCDRFYSSRNETIDECTLAVSKIVQKLQLENAELRKELEELRKKEK